MAKNKPRPARPRPAAPPTFGWVPQPDAPGADALVKSGIYERFGVNRKLLEAQEKLDAHMRSFETIERAEFERRSKPWLIGPESYTGSFIGLRRTAGVQTNELAVVGMVPRKVKEKAQIATPCRLDALQSALGIEIDVVPVGRTRTADWSLDVPDALTFEENKPIRCGASIGPQTATGTYGALVLGNDNQQYILSNNHVLAGVSGIVNGTIGVGLPVGSAVRHRGPKDDDTGTAFPIGTLADPVPALQLATNQSLAPTNTIDAALAKVDPPGAAGYVYSLFGPPGTIEQKYKPLSAVPTNQLVKKVGRTTTLTFGEVVGVRGTGAIQYVVGRDFSNQPVVAYGRFADVLVIRGLNGTKFSDRGDSGSVIVMDTGAERPSAIGLLFAGGSEGGVEYAFAIPMERVFTELKIARFINDV